jgi:two-component system, NtrC family, response regulator AtoC
MREVVERARRVAQSPSTFVLLQGESGTGKEMVARFIHELTPGRGAEAFIELNCAALSEGLVESELFGQEQGVFVDAEASKPGLLELATGGSLFLDDIEELGLRLQTKLLRALETTAFRRLGGTRDLNLNMRILAATNRNLDEEVRAGRFRVDLFHRLDVFHLTLPPLRERREDIPALAHWLLERIAERLHKPVPSLSAKALRILAAYDYPGNLRELRNVLERAVILEASGTIAPSSLLLGSSRGQSAADAFFSVALAGGQPPTLADLEKLYIERLLKHAGGNRSQVARLLDVSYPTVAKKIADYGIKLPD